MLASLVPCLRNKTLVLASGSPRRKELLSNLGVQFVVVPSEFPENLSKGDYVGHPELYVKDNSRFKALDVLKTRNLHNEVVIGCDTVVVLDGDILEKPQNSVEAANFLKKLSGRWHSVYSGLTLAELCSGDGDPNIESSYEKTEVKFADLTSHSIHSYIETEEPFGKAGAYGIQGCGALLIEGIKGDYYNVVGLPLYRLASELGGFLAIGDPHS